MKPTFFAGVLASALILSSPILAEEHNHHSHHGHDHGHGLAVSGGHDHSAALSVPISIMGDHVHNEGDWMFSYRFMRMEMTGNRDGTQSLSPSDISGVVTNRFFGMPMQPSTLRIVPTDMSMDMHMLGAMYAPTDWLTLMAMANYHVKEMDHITFAAMNAANQIGTFTTRTSGLGDTKLGGIFKVLSKGNHQITAKLGLSLPTGSLDERDTILTPMGARTEVRVPYAMQLGTGTYDIEPSMTYVGQQNAFGWGAQYKAAIRLGENDEDYAWGDKHQIQAWGAYKWNEELQSSLRVSYEMEDSIDGIDSNIMGPVQTADPDNYGGERAELGIGFSIKPSSGVLKDIEIASELTLPFYQDLNGPQMQRSMGVTIGFKKSF